MDWMLAKEKELDRLPRKARPFRKKLNYLLREAAIFPNGYNVGKGKQEAQGYSKSVMLSVAGYVTIMGNIMEELNKLLEIANEECEGAKKNLQKLHNDVIAMHKVIAPELLKLIREVRSSRMEVTTELHKALTQLRDVRKFFLEAEYKEEMERLQAFVALAKELKGMIEDGTLDSLATVMLKLAINQEKEEGDDKGESP